MNFKEWLKSSETLAWLWILVIVGIIIMLFSRLVWAQIIMDSGSMLVVVGLWGLFLRSKLGD
jgi:hypothetical protein